MTPIARSHRAGVWGLLLMVGLILGACDEDKKSALAQHAEAQRQIDVQRLAALQAQLEAERAQRQRAQEEACTARESRTRWIISLGTGACAASLVAVLLGVHIGSKALIRYRKEHPDAA